MFVPVKKDKCELDGPFECSVCHGHLMVDFTFIDQVSDVITCPYCGEIGEVKNSVIVVAAY